MTDLAQVVALLTRIETRLVRLMAVHGLNPEGNHVQTSCKTPEKAYTTRNSGDTAGRNGIRAIVSEGVTGESFGRNSLVHCKDQTAAEAHTGEHP